MNKLLTFCILTVLTLNIFAQKGQGYTQGERPKGTIKGKIIDHISKEAVPYATVALYSFRDSSLTTGSLSTDDGSFQIVDVPAGKYKMEIKFIGYEKYLKKEIILRPPNLDLDLGIIELQHVAGNLDAVEIVAEKTYVEYKIDKKVVNVGQDLNSSGGSAVDALENVPSVTVDIDGNVALRGSTSFTVFVNGKPTPLDGTDALQQIPVGAIKNIEIITNPSAKYDPDGLSGIINVVLKENVKLGLNGMINVNASNRGSYGINGIFSYNIGKFNVFVGGNYNNSVWPGEGYNELTTIAYDTTEYRITDLDRERKRDRYNLKAGFDFIPNEKNSFTFEGSFGAHGHDKNFSSKIHEYNLPTSYDYYLFSDNPGTHKSNFYSLSANYEYKLDKNGSNIQALAYYEDENESNEDKSLEYMSNADWSLRDSILLGNITREKESGPQYRFQLDFVKKFENKSKFESGVQLRIRPQYSEYEYEEYQADKGWVLLPDYGSKLNFVRDIYAIYGIYAGEYKSFGYQIGLRGEYTNRNVFDESRDYDFKIQRFDLFPTVHFSKKFKNDHQILLSYSRRIDRPGGWELEPFTRFISSNFQRQGNPELEPEYTDNFELSYQKAIKQSFVSIEGYYRPTNNRIARIQSIDSTGIITMTFENMDRDISTGVELMVNLRVIKWMDINISGNYYYYQLFSSGTSLGEVNNTSNNFDMRGNLNFIVTKTTRLQLNGFYRSASVTAQGKSASNYMISASARQELFKKKVSISLRINDIFNTMRHEFTTEGIGFTSFNSFTPINPTITVDLSYRINNYKEKKNGNGGDFGEGGDGIL
ncbi:MAG: TonB-dependent receptor [Bacteroidales bacterium]|nr:TonB-dependent receptor [Bacteroidales bacterium]